MEHLAKRCTVARWVVSALDALLHLPLPHSVQLVRGVLATQDSAQSQGASPITHSPSRASSWLSGQTSMPWLGPKTQVRPHLTMTPVLAQDELFPQLTHTHPCLSLVFALT